jgi:hypothetical protein
MYSTLTVLWRFCAHETQQPNAGTEQNAIPEFNLIYFFPRIRFRFVTLSHTYRICGTSLLICGPPACGSAAPCLLICGTLPTDLPHLVCWSAPPCMLGSAAPCLLIWGTLPTDLRHPAYRSAAPCLWSAAPCLLICGTLSTDLRHLVCWSAVCMCSSNVPIWNWVDRVDEICLAEEKDQCQAFASAITN